MALSRKQREAAGGLQFTRATRPVAGIDERNGIPAVDGTHRAGKRKRGTSVTKVAPNTNVRAERFDVLNEQGVPLIVGANRVDSINARVSFPVAPAPQFDVARGNEVQNPRVDRRVTRFHPLMVAIPAWVAPSATQRALWALDRIIARDAEDYAGFCAVYGFIRAY